MTRLARVAALIVAVAAIPATVATAGDGLPLRTVANVELPGPSNRFDYASIDPTTGRLWIAHMDAGRLLAFDVRHRRVVQTVKASGVHGVLAVPQVHRVYASATDDHEMLTIDSRTGRVLRRAPAGVYPDGLAYDPIDREVYVSDESGGVESVSTGAALGSRPWSSAVRQATSSSTPSRGGSSSTCRHATRSP